MYREFPAAPLLHSTVDAYWRFDGRGAPHRVLPDGCIDILFDLRSGQARIIGPMSIAELVDAPHGSSTFGVRFRPGAASAYLPEQASKLIDRDLPLDDLSSARLTHLAEHIAEARSDQARCRVLDAFLADPRARVRTLEPRALRASALLSGARDAPSIADVAREVGVGERQLERLFSERVGVRPKLYARIVRMQRALALATRLGPGASQAQVAALAGYADEPHLLRDFRALAGASLHGVLRERHVGIVQGEGGAARLSSGGRSS